MTTQIARSNLKASRTTALAIMFVVAFLVGNLASVGAATAPDATLAAPYDGASGDADPKTGDVVVNHFSESYVISQHTLAAPVQSIEYTAFARITGGSWAMAGSADISVYFESRARSLACNECLVGGAINIRYSHSEGADVPQYGEDQPQNVTLTFLVRNPSGAPIPAGPMEVTTGLVSYVYEGSAVNYFVPTGFAYSTMSATIDRVEARYDPDWLPDLTISSLTVEPENPMVGEPLTFRAHVTNIGNGATTANEIEIGYNVLQIPPLEPGASFLATYARSGMGAGTWSQAAVVDRYNELLESDETNNRAVVSFEVREQPRPDLTIEQVFVQPTQPRAGDVVELYAVVKNNGDAAGGWGGTQFDLDGQYWADGTCSCPGTIDPGETITVNAGRTWTATEGQHTLRVVADPLDSVDESYENNNERSAPFEVAPAAPVAGVDLSPPSQSQSVPARGTATYQITVTNTGNQADTFDLVASGQKNGWTSSLDPSSVTLAPGASTTVTLTTTAANSGSLTVTVTATSRADASMSDSATCRTSVSK